MTLPAPEPTRIPVGLGDRSYDILIGPGLVAGAGARIAALAPGAACAVVTDRTVARHHLPALLASLDAAGVRHAEVVVEPGEGSKSFATYADVCGAVLDGRFERGDLVVALGGGVVGDLAGFVAATLKRGLRFVQIPTTLLAQVDSSVGGKTGINAPQGKNLVGAFHQPALVLADTGCLDTLSQREFRAGYAEVAKYGLIDDAPFFDWLDENRDAVFAGGANGAEARRHAIALSCRSKAAVVARDEHERGDRALLNLGHTFGHALERLTAYDGARLVHGEAVAIGIALAFRFSAAQGICPGGDAARVASHFRAAGLPTRIGDVPGWTEGSGPGAEAVLDAMMQDKKVTRGRLNLILARGIGRSFLAPDVAAAAVRDFLDGEMAKG
ncbi:3-dehydroquinate synthase [Lichenibacterium minor]|uniref:3-dehydroquinate synthase n=1 Tax=Lichenibacterium minor TaxID=2316528 RepID=A0A4Q2U219_9HYPH|nr:3-dehydroquinate synthase [Lichenibacterium minor]RYC30523.1 3-dehydroquinate synthase [Lichenibacterium minor]